ncbi:hypothetical protein EJB05_22761, partial [Eragrostis curvula]
MLRCEVVRVAGVEEICLDLFLHRVCDRLGTWKSFSCLLLPSLCKSRSCCCLERECDCSTGDRTMEEEGRRKR